MEYLRLEIGAGIATGIRKRVLVGLAATGKTVPDLAKYLELEPKDIMTLLWGPAPKRPRWLDHRGGNPERMTYLLATARFLGVPVETLLPWSDPYPLVNALAPPLPPFPSEVTRPPKD